MNNYDFAYPCKLIEDAMQEFDGLATTERRHDIRACLERIAQDLAGVRNDVMRLEMILDDDGDSKGINELLVARVLAK